MRKVAIFMSDFHLGQKDRMEEFHADEEFAELLGRLSLKHADDEVDLILLGDVLDLWTTITDPDEVNPRSSADVQFAFPAKPGSPEFRRATAEEMARAVAVMDRHPKFFEALGLFATFAARRRVLYIPGNHDHSLVHPDLQDEVRKRILSDDVRRIRNLAPAANLDALLDFPNYYYDPDLLKVYAEHGNQLAFAGSFRYGAFDEFGEECPGYYELKLVMNRVERRAAEADNVLMGALSPAQWPGLLWWLGLRIPMGLLNHLRQCRLQYLRDPRIARYREAMPPPLQTVLHFIRSNWLGATQDEFAEEVPLLFGPAGRGVGPLGEGTARSRRNPGTIGGRLDPERIKTVILGHSHQSRDVDLPGFPGIKYYNTGSWIFRYENGRRIIEQAWVTLSCDIPAGASMDGRKDIDRRMDRRRVELPMMHASPVTASGQSLNPLAREMPDLRVGDIVLFRWNMQKEAVRLLKSWQFLTLFRKIPGMVGSWLNRYGTSSHWSHVALVFASPFEPEESDEYNDPLFLEALPEGGIGIHGPLHYLSHRGEWDLAVLRLKIERAPWLHDQGLITVDRRGEKRSFALMPKTLTTLPVIQNGQGPCLDQLPPDSQAARAGLRPGDLVTEVDQRPIHDLQEFKKAAEHKSGWRHRRLLRRLALSTLDAHYAKEEIVRQSLYLASRMLDHRLEQRDHAPLVAGIFKGGIAGLVVGTVLLAAALLVGIFRGLGPVVRRLTATIRDHGWSALWTAAQDRASQSWIAFLAWWQQCDLCQALTADLFLAVVGLILALAVLGITVAAGGALLRVLLTAYGRLAFALGAAWGALIVPVMAEISEEWTEKPPEWRWAATLVWGTIPLVPLVGWYWLDGRNVSALMLALALAIVWAPRRLTDFLAKVVQPVVVLGTRIAASIHRIRGQRQSDQQFMCSGLVQYALYNAAAEVRGDHPNMRPEYVIAHDNPGRILAMPAPERDRLLKETIHRDFAESDHFDWVYLLTNGSVIEKPSEAHKAEVAPDRLKKIKAREVTPRAKWSLRSALLALACTVLHELGPFPWTRHWGMLLAGGMIGLAAVVLAYQAWRELTLNQETVAGRWLTRWGKRIGYIAILSAAAAAVTHLLSNS